jgi:hypothetical protein
MQNLHAKIKKIAVYAMLVHIFLKAIKVTEIQCLLRKNTENLIFIKKKF